MIQITLPQKLDRLLTRKTSLLDIMVLDEGNRIETDI